ncbi:MAG: type I glutamate--ammonia ligase [Oscillospiraceae bacterium]|nr:type I glutamate--ammonia ligase [Oscillospiraceae bacterium]
MGYTKEDILRIAKENNVEFIRLQFTDIFGQLKNVAISDIQLEKVLDDGAMFDGSSIEGFVRINESDMYLKPDYDTFTILPWKAGVARLICDVYSDRDTPFAGDPRYIFRKAIKEAADMGYTFNVGPECEFFLFELDENGNPTTKTADVAGYFDMGPADQGEQCRRDVCLALQEMGYMIEASHHEVAEGQHEIDFRFAEALDAADKVVTFKHVVKTYARRHGLHATFMPKPVFGINGSGMHTNMSLMKDGKNAFYDPDDKYGLSKTAYHFIAGLLAHVKGIAAVSNPLVNSYKRLVPGYEAPVYISWSASNRSALIRVPAARGMGTRVELRCPDPSCNPYLEMALCLAAGLDGIKKGMEAPEGITKNIFEMSADELKENGIESLPGSLSDALDEFEADPFIKEALGEHIYEKYLEGKRKEWDDYRTKVSQWEIGEYLTKY